ncbi:hypothetical protein SAMN04487943_101632 [Gracilibacillus orientalis]|uniref:Uncharacterized protein n=1 Tax=Gracilibacillus orientalis TaxID=334253 RepID=A0A1I4HUA8_9BACI|nr:hypothetical protein [Gracilibacillus orientalis]SFL45390.1 hypothetical protein SAMN04487943_101632 [Gracilibacillus orientalis]
MSKYKVKKFLYALVHIIAPIIYLVVSIAWGFFFTSKTLLDNITDNLCILAIWYIGISVLWFFSINYLNGQAEKISKEIDSKHSNAK